MYCRGFKYVVEIKGNVSQVRNTSLLALLGGGVMMNLDASWISAVSAGVSVLISCVSAYIAYTAKKVADKQNENSRLQVNLGLYDKRYRIYNEVKLFISEIVRDGGNEYKRILTFHRETSETLFLFKEEVCEYMVKVSKNADKLNDLNKKLNYDGLSDVESEKVADSRDEVFAWFSDQLRIGIHETFMQYLDFTHVQGK